MREQSRLRDARKEDGFVDEDRRGADVRETDSGRPNSDEGATNNSAYVAELEARAREAEQQMLNLRSRFEQMRDEFERQTDDTRQRLNLAADERALRAKRDFITALLPVLDNLQRALESARESGSTQSLLDGVERTVKGFDSALASVGVEPVQSVGKLFDPEMHEAVVTVEAGDEEDGVVTQEYSRGYKLGGRLLRPARVQVGSALRSSSGLSASSDV